MIAHGASPGLQAEITAEIAAHLEDVQADEMLRGAKEDEAIQCALNQVDDWRRLQRKISRLKKEEGQMNARMKTFWIPALVSFLSTIGTMLAIHFRFRSGTLQQALQTFVTFLPWLLATPVIGGLAAYLSRRAEGERWTRLGAALFPAIVMFFTFCLLGIVAAMVDRHVPARTVAYAFSILTAAFAVIPGIGLLVGALPFLTDRKISGRAEANG
jgi:hypothetical protein